MKQDPGTIDVDAMMEAIRRELQALDAPAVSADEAFARVRAEVLAHRATNDGQSAHAGDLAWTPVLPPLAVQPQYTLPQLLAYSDVAFLETAYRAVLKRDVDEPSRATLLPQLRDGSLDKVELLARLRWSPEGVARGVHVDGLLVPTVLRRWRRKRFIGPVIAWAHAVLHLGREQVAQQSREALQAAETQALGRALNATAADARERIDERTRALAEEAAALSASLKAAEATIATSQQAIASLEAMLAALRARVERTEQDAFQAKVARARADEDARAAADTALHAHDGLYADFEDVFRGSKDLVRERAMPYLDDVRGANAGTPDAPILDLGCGRGEWLELLREQGLKARGVDLNRVFLARCREAGLDVVEGDAIAVLSAVPTESLGAVTSMHLVEHLSMDDMMALIRESRRALRPGGVLILETPNPENLDVATYGFYMDPTHRNPLPPDMLRWLVQSQGFADVRIERLTAARDIDAPAVLDPSLPGATSINPLLAKRAIAPDYAIVARRP